MFSSFNKVWPPKLLTPKVYGQNVGQTMPFVIATNCSFYKVFYCFPRSFYCDNFISEGKLV
jgi:hypothetical protein